MSATKSLSFTDYHCSNGGSEGGYANEIHTLTFENGNVTHDYEFGAASSPDEFGLDSPTRLTSKEEALDYLSVKVAELRVQLRDAEDARHLLQEAVSFRDLADYPETETVDED